MVNYGQEGKLRYGAGVAGLAESVTVRRQTHLKGRVEVGYQ